VENQFHASRETEERAGYFDVPGAFLYTVLHQVKDPVARVMLVGPFASERHNSYTPWVRWARYLAAENIEVLRFDYRGIGESTGVFDEMTFADWSQDIHLLYSWFTARSPHVPILLHGLGMGAVLAGRAFDGGVGDGLLLWSPPANANQALRATLMRWVGLEQIFKFGREQKSASDYIRHLEHGTPLEVDGYRWSVNLWRDSFQLTLPAALASQDIAARSYRRPVKIVTLTRAAAPLARGGQIGFDDLKDFNWLFAPNCEWIAAAALQLSKGLAYA
jgi:hypothetical protein